MEFLLLMRFQNTTAMSKISRSCVLKSPELDCVRAFLVRNENGLKG